MKLHLGKRPLALRCTLFITALVGVALLGSGSPALAKEKEFDFCLNGSQGGQCNSPRGIAVNETGNGGVPPDTLYVAEFSNNRIQSFDSEGNFLRAWGWDVIIGGATGFEVCEVAANCKAGEPGSGAGQFSSIAVGVTVDQATGAVYIVDRGNRRVQQFDAVGNFIRAWGWDVIAGGGTGFEICEAAEDCKAGVAGGGGGQFGAAGGASVLGIGTDSSGNVYVADAGNSRVQKFNSSGSFLRLAGWDVVAGGGTGFEVCAVAANCKSGVSGSSAECQFEAATPSFLAVSPTGDVYAVDRANNRIYHLISTLECDGAVEIPTEGAEPRAVAVSRANGHLFLAKSAGETIYEFDPNSAELIETTPAGASNWQGLAVNSVSSRMYASAPSNQLTDGKWIRAFDPSFSVVTDPASGVTTTSAVLNGKVNPAGDAVGECFFEYTERPNFEAEEFEGAEEAQCSPNAGEIGSGTSPIQVSADAAGLKTGTEYRFRLVAESAGPSGRVDGNQRSFTTPGAAIKATWAEDVGFTEALLKAEINSAGKATSYRFEYGTSELYGQQTPELAVGSDSADHEVGAALEGLAPGTTYHYRVVATNADGQNVGPDRVFTTYLPLASHSCPGNEAFRVEPSDRLPDCRAYEMVSPPDKRGGDIIASASFEAGREASYRQASSDGERVTFSSTSTFGDALRSTRSNQYLASRGPGAWSTHALNSPLGTTVFDITPAPISEGYDLNTNFMAFTPDLCFGLMRDHNLVPLSEEAIFGYTNLYLRDNCGQGADSYRALTIGPPPSYSQFEEDLFLQARAYSGDLEHIVFSAMATLESTPPPSGSEKENAPQLYDFSGGVLRLVSVLPNEEANPDGALLGSGAGFQDNARGSNVSRAVSEDGSRIFWTRLGSRTLYLRVDGQETVQLSDGPPSEFWTADREGSVAIFSEGGDLFEFDVEKALDGEAGAKIPVAGEVGGVVGTSEDLSYLYFTSKEALSEGGIEGKWNLYLRKEGEVRFVAAIAPEDRTGYKIDGNQPIDRSSRVTPDGRHLAFMSFRPPSGFDNTDVASGKAVYEVFRYDAGANGGAGELVCASCKPSGARPLGGILNRPYTKQPFTDGSEPRAAAWIPTWEWTNHAKRSLSDDGDRLFFNAFDALVPEDTNGAQDVYQWEAPGSGSCKVGDPRYFARNGGCLSLISTGRSGVESVFLDASADGRDVFFTTSSDIDPRDLGHVDVYDASEGGGFPPPSLEPPACVGDACQVVPAAPAAQTPASASFRGPGDRSPAAKKRCPKGKRAVRRRGKVRCVRKQKRRRAAGHDRRAKR